MMSMISSSQWGSFMEPTFATEDLDLQYSAIPALQSGDFNSSAIIEDEQLPSIDESVFDLIDERLLEEAQNGTSIDTSFEDISKWCGIPDLEEVFYEPVPSPSQPSLNLDEIPPLEEVVLSEESKPSPRATTASIWSPKHEASTWVSPQSSPMAPSPAMYEEEVQSIIPTSDELCIASSPSCGAASPASSSCSFVVPDMIDKRRRVSQISMASTSSFDTSGGSSPSSDFSLSEDCDTPVSTPEVKRRGGRKSKFTAEDRKERKKAQNRTAAERYRLKRKLIDDVVTEEETKLIEENDSLKTEVTRLEAEVSCMKRLMRDMLKAKGIEIPPKKSKSSA